MLKVLKIDILEMIYIGIMVVVILGFWLAMFWHLSFLPWLRKRFKK